MAREHAQDIVAALNNLGGNLQRLQLQRTLTQANEAVQQIRSSEADEAEQRAALRDVAQQLTFNLTAQGASPQQVQQIGQQVAPFQEAERVQALSAARTRGQLGVQMQAQQMQQGRQAMILEAAMQGNTRAMQMLPKETRERFVPGAGLATTKQAANDIRKLTTEIDPAMKGLERLKEINKISGAKFSPELRSEAFQLQKTIMGGLRVALIGPGTVNPTELELLNTVIKNPTDFFSISSLNEKALDTLQGALDQKLTSAYSAAGITPPNAADMPFSAMPGFRVVRGNKRR